MCVVFQSHCNLGGELGVTLGGPAAKAMLIGVRQHGDRVLWRVFMQQAGRAPWGRWRLSLGLR